MTVHASHRVNDPDFDVPRSYRETHCSACGLDIDDERIEAPCFEEPLRDPYSAPDAWEGGFAANH